ncbi:MAG: SHOCT domain-containing protein [Draconibacterium sp.]|nr:SHOCT domain-containing protein [Draconibacterium sp.]
MHGLNGMGWGMGFGWIIGLVAVILIIWVISRTVNKNNYFDDPDKSAFEMLKERYARGEISKEQYEQTRSDIL